MTEKEMMENHISDSQEYMTRAEKTVAEFLKKHRIDYLYEQGIFVVDDKNRPRVWSPDFYLPELGIYIEVCGFKNHKYKYRQIIYKENKIPIIFVHEYKLVDKWQNYLIEQMNDPALKGGVS